MRHLLKAVLATHIALGLPIVCLAADHEVKMLNYGAEGSMVFEPAVLKVDVGDTVTFLPTNSGHNVRSYATPDGVKAWNTPIDQKATVTIEKPGVYVYYCPPHLMMSMIAVIQAGEPVNLDAVRQKAEKLRSKLVMKGERLDEYFSQVK